MSNDFDGGMSTEVVGGMNKYQEQQQNDVNMDGGRRRRSRTRRGKRGRKGRGGYLTDIAVAAGFLGATQLAKRRAGYGFTGKNGYSGNTRRRGSRRSKRSSRSRGRR